MTRILLASAAATAGLLLSVTLSAAGTAKHRHVVLCEPVGQIGDDPRGRWEGYPGWRWTGDPNWHWDGYPRWMWHG
jgi:hypothetical protein